ncbi:MAG: prenyltransferase/squalene oxidase repeat-containing protein [Acidobacteriota bacterium]
MRTGTTERRRALGITGGLFLGGVMLAAAAAAQTEARGVAFLVAGQAGDGRWNSAEVRPTQATTEALRALQDLGIPSGARAAAGDFLSLAPIEDSDDRARRIVALGLEGRNVASLAADLATAADSEGGWGLASRYGNDPLDSALALEAFAQQPILALPELSEAFLAFLSLQNADGGWPCVTVADQPADSEIYCTGLAVSALARFGGQFYVEPQIARAIAYLRSQENPDGGFGSPGAPDAGAGSARIVRTASAALGLAAAGALRVDGGGADPRPISAFLSTAQQPDGGWSRDPFTTALALRAFHALAAAPFCGDGVAEPPIEACDGLDLRGRTCGSFGLGAGILGCSATCGFDTAHCTVAPFCGDGVINRPGELCDGADFGGRSCDSLGLGGGSLGCTATCGLNTNECASTGVVDPPTLSFDSTSAFCAGQPQTVPVTLTLPTGSAIDKVDVFFLTSRLNFSVGGTYPELVATLTQTVPRVQSALPGVSVGFGVGQYGNFGGPQPAFSTDDLPTRRAFTLLQPIITPEIPNFSSLLAAAIQRDPPSSARTLSAHEALWQIATGAGFDGDGNGSTLGSGPAGALLTISSPGSSGDIPAFSSNVAPSSGTRGGVGFRDGALSIVVLFSDWCPLAAYDPALPIPDSLTGVGGVVVSNRPFTCIDDVSFGPRRRIGFVSNSLSLTGNTVATAVAPRRDGAGGHGGAANPRHQRAGPDVSGVHRVSQPDGRDQQPLQFPVGDFQAHGRGRFDRIAPGLELSFRCGSRLDDDRRRGPPDRPAGRRPAASARRLDRRGRRARGHGGELCPGVPAGPAARRPGSLRRDVRRDRPAAERQLHPPVRGRRHGSISRHHPGFVPMPRGARAAGRCRRRRRSGRDRLRRPRPDGEFGRRGDSGQRQERRLQRGDAGRDPGHLGRLLAVRRPAELCPDRPRALLDRRA